MKRFYALLLVGLFAMPAFAQNGKAPQLPVEKRIPQPMPEKSYTGDEYIPQVPYDTRPDNELTFSNDREVVISEAIIGITQYDLQSNAAVDNRALLSGDDFRGAWTMSLSSGSFDDRGTGFNEYVDGAWGPEPIDRIESVRIGWPSLIETASGRVLAISHAGIDTPLHVAYRDDSSWEEYDMNLGDLPGHLWPRAAVGGDDGNTIHVVCISTPEANGGALYEGQDGAILYFRSTDGGDTWDIENMMFPELNSDNFLGFDGDIYQISARGNQVAFGVFNDLGDSFVMISDDNGDTWSYNSLVDFPVDNYVVDSGLPDDQGDDFDEDGVFQEYFNTDGAGSVLITPDGTVHVFYGEMYYMDADLTDTNFSYFPGVNGLAYWNDTMEENTFETIAYAYDLDESGTWDIDEIALYFVSGAGMPSASHDADGNIYVSYSALMESHSSGVQSYRHIYIVRSEDGGVTWNSDNACNVTPDADFDFYEAVFAAQAPVIDDEIHLIYQRDFEPGLHVRGDEDPIDVNDIVHLGIETDQLLVCDEDPEIEIVSVDEPLEDGDLEIYPNPASDRVNLILNKRGSTTIQIFNMTGQEVFNETVNTSLRVLDVSDFASGVYVIQLTLNGSQLTEKLTIE